MAGEAVASERVLGRSPQYVHRAARRVFCGASACAKQPARIAEQTGVALAHVGKYLHTLVGLGFIRRLVSAEAMGRPGTRASRYEIRDPYLRFHFTFVQPNLQLLEQRRGARLMQLIRAGFDAYVGRTGYEELCRRYVARLSDQGSLPVDALAVGRTWTRDVEVDVAAVDARAKAVLLGECRWRKRPMNVADLERLQQNAAKLSKLAGHRKHLALFSRAGFTTALRKEARAGGVLLFESVPWGGDMRK